MTNHRLAILCATVSLSALLADDVDPDGTALSITSVYRGVNGSVALDGTDAVFTPRTGYYGTASFNYTLTNATISGAGFSLPSTQTSVPIGGTGTLQIVFSPTTANPAQDRDMALLKRLGMTAR